MRIENFPDNRKIPLKILFPNFLTANDGIFSVMGNKYDLPWNGIENINQTLDILYFTNHSGGKTISTLVFELYKSKGDDFKDTLASVAYNMYNKTWTRLWEAYNVEYNPIENYRMEEKEDTRENLDGTNDISRVPNLTVTHDEDSSTVNTPEITESKNGAINENETVIESGSNTTEYGKITKTSTNETNTESVTENITENGEKTDSGTKNTDTTNKITEETTDNLDGTVDAVTNGKIVVESNTTTSISGEKNETIKTDGAVTLDKNDSKVTSGSNNGNTSSNIYGFNSIESVPVDSASTSGKADATEKITGKDVTTTDTTVSDNTGTTEDTTVTGEQNTTDNTTVTTTTKNETTGSKTTDETGTVNETIKNTETTENTTKKTGNTTHTVQNTQAVENSGSDKLTTSKNDSTTRENTNSETVKRTGIDTTTNTLNFTDRTTGKDDTLTHTEEERNGSRNLTRSGNIGVTTSQQMLKSEIELWKWNFFESIFADMDKLLTLAIYV